VQRKYLLITLLVALLVSSAQVQGGEYNIKDFGALADGVTVNSAAIQKAINTCHEAGGGTVTIPAGVFVSGTIRLLSNVNLYLEAGAVLSGSLNLADYTFEGEEHGLIFADEAVNISITGSGEILGNGTHFMLLNKSHISEDFERSMTRQGEKFMPADQLFADGPVAYTRRPDMLLVILKCENVLLSDVTFRDAPSWTIRLGDCDNVAVRGINIMNNLLIPNSDGIHCTTSRNVRISDCDIRAGDDAIIVTGFGLKTDVSGDYSAREVYTDRTIGNKTGYAENVTVTNCVLTSRSSGIRVGYGDNSIRNCTFQNIIIYGSNRGIGVFARDLGSIENILFSDIIIQTRLHSGHWWGKGEPIHVSAIPQAEGYELGQIKNIRFSNILAEAETGIVVWGTESKPALDVHFDHIQLKINDSPLNAEYGGNFDLRPTRNPGEKIFKHDIPGLYANHINNLVIKDLKLEWANKLPEFMNHAIHCEHFVDVLIDGFSGRQPHLNDNRAAIALNDGSGVIVRNCVAEPGTGIFLSHQNVTRMQMFVNNDMSLVKKVLEPEKSEFLMQGNVLKVGK